MDKKNIISTLEFVEKLLYFVTVPAVLYFVTENFVAGFNGTWLTILASIGLYEIFAFALLFISESGKAALYIEGFLSFIWMLVNGYLMKWRSSPLVPWDFYSIKTAMSVADEYSFVPDIKQFFGIVLFGIIGIFIYRFIKLNIHSIKESGRMAGFLVSAFALSGWITMIIHGAFPLYDAGYNQNLGAAFNGSVVNFIYRIKDIHVMPPEGYSDKEAQNILSEYDEKEDKKEDPANIIVIMCEAFSDPSVLGDVGADKDYIPFIKTMLNGAENTKSGMLNVSVIGGNTVNTEWEFLTGNTTRFIPSGTLPYQQYINDTTDLSYSLPAMLNRQGYKTISLHPYRASGYRRDAVYKAMGFQESLFEDDFQNVEKVRNFISDKSLFERIIKEYENKEPGKPLFEFAVTMQNHAFYSDKDEGLLENEKQGIHYTDTGKFSIKPDIRVNNPNAESLETYLTLEHITDGDLRNLIEYFDKQDEKTVIVFFGDHQPAKSVTEPVVKKEGIQEEDYFKVPFFIHANYDIDEEDGLDISPNFLGGKTIETAKARKTSYQRFLDDVEAENPVISVARGSNETNECMKKYRIVEHYLVFEKQNS